MDFNKTVDLIIRDLDEAGEIIDDIKNYPGVPPIQIELAKSKIRNASEVIALFKNLPPAPKTEDVKMKSEESQLRKAEPETQDRRKVTEIKQNKVTYDEKHTETVTKPASESSIIADKFSKMSDSLNEKLGSMREDEDVPGYMKTKPLSNLKEAIGINDRFLFIRELFNGDSNSYSQAIAKIDEAACLSDAKALLTDIAGIKTDSEAGKQLIDLLKRKFPGHE